MKRPANAKVRNDTDDPNALESLSWARTVVMGFDFSGGQQRPFLDRWRSTTAIRAVAPPSMIYSQDESRALSRSCVVSWSLPFSEPIVMPDGSELATLQDAYDHLNKLPKFQQDTKEWKAAAQFLIEAAEHAGAVAFARISIVQAMKQQADRGPTLELVDLTMREVQQLKTDREDPILRDQASLSLPGVMQAIDAIVSSPAVPVELSNPTSTGRGRKSLWSLIKPTDDRRLIASETLRSAITKAVQKADPAFVDVIIQRITPKSRFDTNWALRGVKFGRADRERANQAVTTVVERMQREFRLSDD